MSDRAAFYEAAWEVADRKDVRWDTTRAIVDAALDQVSRDKETVDRATRAVLNVVIIDVGDEYRLRDFSDYLSGGQKVLAHTIALAVLGVLGKSDPEPQPPRDGLGPLCECGHGKGYHEFPPGPCQVRKCSCGEFVGMADVQPQEDAP